MKSKDRIKSFQSIPAKNLLPNSKNWRTHPRAQSDALRGVLAEIGFADAVIIRETPEGLQLLHGHLRAKIAVDAMIPCLVVEVTDEGAKKILATHDPLAAMAEVNAEKLAKSLDEIETSSQAVSEMLFARAADSGTIPPDF